MHGLGFTFLCYPRYGCGPLCWTYAWCVLQSLVVPSSKMMKTKSSCATSARDALKSKVLTRHIIFSQKRNVCMCDNTLNVYLTYNACVDVLLHVSHARRDIVLFLDKIFTCTVKSRPTFLGAMLTSIQLWSFFLLCVTILLV